MHHGVPKNRFLRHQTATRFRHEPVVKAAGQCWSADEKNQLLELSLI